jgi:phosphatidylinositol glycan class A protein
MYTWHDVAKRTDEVYKTVMRLQNPSLADRFERCHSCGLFAGKFAVMIIAVNYLLWMFLEWLYPRCEIDIAPTFDQKLFHDELRNIKKKGV